MIAYDSAIYPPSYSQADNFCMRVPCVVWAWNVSPNTRLTVSERARLIHDIHQRNNVDNYCQLWTAHMKASDTRQHEQKSTYV
jgi:hypothetical protein